MGYACPSLNFYLKGEDGRRKRDAEEAPPQVGGAQVTLIAILRSLSVKTKENMDFALLMQLSTFQLFLEFLFIFFKFADERSRELKRPATRCHVKDDKDLFR